MKRPTFMAVALIPPKSPSRLLFASPAIRLGTFRCPVNAPDFSTAGLIDAFHVCFPRTSCWLEFEDAPRFVADASRATLYNPYQPFARAPISPDGDHTDWIALSDSLARDVVGHFNPADATSLRAFRFGVSGVSQSTYLLQRALFVDVERGLADRLAIEERTVAIVSRVLATAYASTQNLPIGGRKTQHLVENAREAILESLAENLGVAEIAARLSVSVFHLCRVFRASTGTTLHAYRRDMRLRAALGLVQEHRGQLSSLAMQVGFYSHAHFTRSFRSAFGVAPSADAQWRDSGS